MLKTSLTEIKSEQQTVTSQLDQSVPNLLELNTAAEAAGKALSASIAETSSKLETRDREISEKLHTSFAKIDAQIENVQLQASAVESTGNDMIRLRVDVQNYVSSAFASLQQKDQGGGWRTT